MRVPFLLLLALALPTAPSACPAASEDLLPRGRIVDPVVSRQDATQSYALYLPAAYRPDRAWPVVYCLDPRGRGQVPVALFKDEAETLGYILVGSNNSRNGPWAEIAVALSACWQDSRRRLAIDEGRVYAAGFSGGARAACGMGKILSVPLAGVIGCGAGLPEWLTPADFAPTPWFGTAGLRDFNFQEMRELDERLAQLGSARRLETFPGAHSWPPPEVAAAALRWLELQAMKRQLRPRDEALLAGWQDRALARAAELEAEGGLGEAYLEYVKIAADFDSTPAAKAAGENASRLEGRREVQAFLKAERSREKEYAARLAKMKAAYARLAGPFTEPGLGRKIISRLGIQALKRDADQPGNGPGQVVAARLLSELFMKAAESGDRYLAARDGTRALVAFQILDEIRPGRPDVTYGLASARALLGERKKALKALGEAVALGFSDRAAVAVDPAWEGLRADPEFAAILASMAKVP